MRRATSVAPFVAALATLALAPGCVVEWLDWFDQIGNLDRVGDEYRVRDLRVLALEVDPPEIVYPAEVLTLDEDDARLDEMPPLRVRARGFAFDPRGGEISVGLQLCAGPYLDPFLARATAFDCPEPDELAALPADVAAALSPIARTVAARVDEDPAGPVDDLDFEFELSARALRELARQAGQTEPDLPPVVAQVQLQVSRRVDGQAENEVAVLPLYLRADVLSDTAPPEVREAVLSNWNAEVCDPESPPDCIPAFPLGDPEAPHECGDLLVEGPELCDPPDGQLCDDECRIIGACAFTCVYDTPPNTRPRLYGFDAPSDVVMEPRLSLVDDAEIRPGGVVRTAPGSIVHLRAVLDEARVSERHMVVPPPSFGPPSQTTDSLSFGWYLVGNDGDIVNPREFDNRAYVPGAISYQAPTDRAPGDRDVIFVVVHDLFGGATFSRVLVEYQAP